MRGLGTVGTRAPLRIGDTVQRRSVIADVTVKEGRTGTLWAYEQTEVVPDALTSAKALGNWFPTLVVAALCLTTLAGLRARAGGRAQAPA